MANEKRKTVVETFIEDEIKEMVFDAELIDEWKSKVDELQLEGQKKLMAEPEKSPNPFHYLNQAEKRVWDTLCPKKELAAEYSKSPIPIEVLSLMALAEKEKHFQRIEIWYHDNEPDPILVGVIEKQDSWATDNYLMARWGAEKASFPELATKAIKMFKETKLAKLKDKLFNVERQIKDIDNVVAEYFKGEWVNFHD